MIAAPNTEENVHLEVLSRLSMLLMDDEFRTNLLDAADVTEFLAHIDEAERKKFPEEYGEEKQEQDQDQPEEGYRVLAVTACPTGIAHTYMAAESLENKAKEMGISIKVETNGSGGAKNVLSRRTADRSNKRKSGSVSQRFERVRQWIWRRGGKPWKKNLQGADERCLSYASFRNWRRNPDRDGISV